MPLFPSHAIKRPLFRTVMGVALFATAISMGHVLRGQASIERAYGDAVILKTGANPTFVLAADVNGDGRLDLVTTSALDGRVQVLTGEGNGTFTPPAGVSSSGSPSYKTAVCDLNRDGMLDIVAPNLTEGTVSIILARSTDEFASPIAAKAGAGPVAIACGDLTGDGSPDIVTANVESSDLTLLVNDGSASFVARVQRTGTNAAPRDVVLADLDRDGDTDIVTVNTSDATATVLMNDGSAMFAPPRLFSTGAGARAVTSADVNGDGAPDLVTANPDGQSISVLLNERGRFPRARRYQARGPLSVQVADLNQDKRPDIIVAQPDNDTVAVFTGRGDGTFAPSIEVSSKGRQTSSVAIADVNGDGRVDIITSNTGSGSVSVLLNGVAVPRVIAASPKSPDQLQLDGTALRGDIRATFNTPLDSSTVAAGVVVYGSQSGFHDARAQYVASENTIHVAPASQPRFFPGESVNVVFTTSLRSDAGLPLAAAYTVTSYVRPTAGSGELSEAQRIGCKKIPGKLRAADIDNDGNVDVVALCREVDGVRVHFNSGNAVFGVDEVFLPTGGLGPWDLFAADLDRNGHIDIAVVNTFTSNLTVFYNEGHRKFSAPRIVAAGAGPMGITSADLNGDGYLDLVAVTKGNPEVLIFMNTRHGGFTDPVSYKVAPSPYDVKAHDLNGDGSVDLVMTNLESDRGTFLVNNGDGTFRSPEEFPLLLAKALVDDPIDVNNDGVVDMVTVNTASDDLSIFINSTIGNFRRQKNVPVGPTPTDQTFADFDIDGFTDLAVTLDGGQVVLLRNDHSGSFVKTAEVSVGTNPKSIVSADFNGDGAMDLMVANQYSFDLSLLLNRTAQALTRAVTPPTHEHEKK